MDFSIDSYPDELIKSFMLGGFLFVVASRLLYGAYLMRHRPAYPARSITSRHWQNLLLFFSVGLSFAAVLVPASRYGFIVVLDGLDALRQASGIYGWLISLGYIYHLLSPALAAAVYFSNKKSLPSSYNYGRY